MKEISYRLVKGDYVIADPGFIILKNREGTKFITKLWKKFYQNPQTFQCIKINRIKIYITPTFDEDSIVDGVATDTGAIVVIHLKYLNNHKIFKENVKDKYTKIVSFDKDTDMIVNNHKIIFK